MKRVMAGEPLPRAVLLDLDGTLYHQSLLRLLMAPDVARLAVIERGGIVRALWTFRRAREDLRRLGAPAEELRRLQYTKPASILGCDPAWLETIVDEWIMQRPLRFLPHCRRAGIVELLDELQRRAIPAGVFSDYPTTEKLAALGLSGRFALELCATDPEVNAFKPHPRGFSLACERLGVPPEDALYIGDRAEIDRVGATASGMRAAIISAHAGFRHVTRRMFAYV
jgi:FMN phosphatase YigB (HAD superfamily)